MVVGNHRRWGYALLMLLFLLLSMTRAFAQENAPTSSTLTSYVADSSHFLDKTTQDELNHRLAIFEQQTGNQIVIATVKSLKGETIEQYANNLYNDWNLGQKNQDNSVLLLIVGEKDGTQTTQQVYFLAGYGVVEKFSDEVTRSIIYFSLKPAFVDKQFEPRVKQTVSVIMDTLLHHYSGEIYQGYETQTVWISFVAVLVVCIVLLWLRYLYFSDYRKTHYFLIGCLVANLAALPLSFYHYDPFAVLENTFLLQYFGTFTVLVIVLAFVMGIISRFSENKWLYLLFIVLSPLGFWLSTIEPSKFPELTGHVVDEANMLTPATRRQVANRLAKHERLSSDQVIIATIPSLENSTVDTYANSLFRHWGLGQKDKNNGVLLLIALNDRKMRIEVGYGLEGLLTDAIAGRIITDTLRPAFKKKDYDKGVIDASRQIIDVLDIASPTLAIDNEATSGQASTGNHQTTASASPLTEVHDVNAIDKTGAWIGYVIVLLGGFILTLWLKFKFEKEEAERFAQEKIKEKSQKQSKKKKKGKKPSAEDKDEEPRETIKPTLLARAFRFVRATWAVSMFYLPPAIAYFHTDLPLVGHLPIGWVIFSSMIPMGLLFYWISTWKFWKVKGGSGHYGSSGGGSYSSGGGYGGGGGGSGGGGASGGW